ncbi:hypothetical protein BDZ94DRAFT_1276384, partial [Collybia nuda]
MTLILRPVLLYVVDETMSMDRVLCALFACFRRKSVQINLPSIGARVKSTAQIPTFWIFVGCAISYISVNAFLQPPLLSSKYYFLKHSFGPRVLYYAFSNDAHRSQPRRCHLNVAVSIWVLSDI